MNKHRLRLGTILQEMETQSMPMAMPLAQHQHQALQMYQQQQHNRRRHKPNVHVNAAETMSLEDAAKLEMASLPTKTPVSVLQELLSRRGNTPNYELVQIEGAIHEPIFRYRVLLNSEFVATGTGRSKKEAKHAAAKNLLDLLVGLQTSEQANSGGTTGPNGIPIDGINTTLPPSLYPNSSGDESSKVAGNPIGWLQEMCMSRRWPPPTYDMEHEEGLPHERLFTICCRVLKYREQGTGRSKKLAKRMAAHKMWQQLQELPASEVGNMVIAAGDDDELINRPQNPQTRYAGLKDSKVSTLFNNPNSNKVTQFHKLLKNARGAKVKDLQAASLCTKDFNHVQFLQEIAGELKFEVTYVDIEEKSITGKFQCLVQMSTLPVAVCYGRGATSKDAQISAAHNALEYLKVMTRK